MLKGNCSLFIYAQKLTKAVNVVVFVCYPYLYMNLIMLVFKNKLFIMNCLLCLHLKDFLFTFFILYVEKTRVYLYRKKSSRSVCLLICHVNSIGQIYSCLFFTFSSLYYYCCYCYYYYFLKGLVVAYTKYN